jgi:putative aldouronate transport system substrate-binding protein
MMYHANLFDNAGVHLDKAPRGADEFKRMLQAVTRPQENQYGIAVSGFADFELRPGSPFLAIFRAPNNWRLDSSGRLTKEFESEQYRAAVGFARDLWQLGVWHPNTPTYASGALNDDFVAGRFAVAPNSWNVYVQQWDLAAARNPDARIYPMHPFAADGGKPQYNAGPGNNGLTHISQQSSPERLKMLLRVANFFASPFGTTEWLLCNFGVKDLDFTFDDAGAPVLTDRGRSELSGAGWSYITSPAPPLFSGYRSQEFATVSHTAEQAMLEAMEPDPTLGLYSPTVGTHGTQAQETFMSGVSDIVVGRRPLTDLDALVANWRSSGGDKMRAEFQDALQRA